MIKDKLNEKIEEYVNQGYSCAETTIRVLSDVFGYKPKDELLRMTSTFRGGAGIDGKCGIAESALAFLSCLAATDEYRCSQEELSSFSVEIHNRMNEKFGGYQCAYLWDLFISQNRDVDISRNVDCVIEDGIAVVCDTLEDIIEKMRRKH